MQLLKPTLQNRVIATLVGFALGTGLIVGLAGHWYNEALERVVWGATVEAELSHYLDHRHEDPDAFPPQTAKLRTYVRPLDDPISPLVPSLFRGLRPGVYDDFRVGDARYCAVVRDVGSERIYMVYDVTREEAKESELALTAMLSIVALGGIVFGISMWLARDLVAPIRDLARRVSQLDPADRGLSLGDKYRDTEVATIAGAFDQYLARLDGFVRREQEFTATVSHELRTPVAVLAGAMDILEGIAGMPEAAEQPLARIRRAQRSMTESISALLYLAREEISERQIAGACRLNELLPEVIEEHRYLLTGKDLSIHLVHLEATTLAAPARMAHIVVSNIIRNAIEHTATGRVEIILRGGSLTVTDTGPGIVPEDIDRILQARMRGGSGVKEGSGLGLHIARRICARFGWTIALDSRPGAGTRVRVDFGASLAKS